MQVGVTQNQVDQVYPPASVSFTYQSVLLLTSISPAVGSTAGGLLVTINGGNFYSDDRPACMFDSQLVNATVLDSATLTCRTPAHVSAIIQLAVSGNSVDWVSNAAAVTFRYIACPSCLPLFQLWAGKGGTLVTISGVNFLTTADVSYSCQFAGPSSAAVNATVINSRRSAARLLPSVSHLPYHDCHSALHQQWRWRVCQFGCCHLHLHGQLHRH